MAQYQQLTIEEREKIQSGLWQRKSIREIAYELGRSPSTVSREVRRNIPAQHRRYTPRLAQERLERLRVLRGRRFRLKHSFIREYVVEKLKEDYSPEQIAGRLRIDYLKYSISHEAIYQYIYSQCHRGGHGLCFGEDLRKYLKRGHKRRKRRHLSYKARNGAITERIFIDERPTVVEERTRYGDWEGDSMVSKKSPVGLNILVERKSGLVLITKIMDGSKDETTKAVVTRLEHLPQNLKRTLTLDNGSENAGHRDVAQELNLRCFFAHAYHAWERGTCENTCGLIRWYLPKGTDIATVNNEHIKLIENKLNNRPRKRHGFLTPLEVLKRRVAFTYRI